MSMFRQLWLAIISCALLALVISLLASTLSARDYLEEQLSLKNEDNASSLALSLSQETPDPVHVELVVSAMFDSGHYELIRVTDPNGKLIVERLGAGQPQDAPQWLAHALPIQARAGYAQISNGWKQFGSVTIISHSRFAYQSLWQIILKEVAGLMFAGLLSGYLGTLILRRLQRPLDRLIEQAKALTEHRFITMPAPSVPELSHLGIAMNATVERLKIMFEEEAGRLEQLRREANCDPLTGLVNRNHFMAQLNIRLADEDTGACTLALIRVANLVEINRRLGRNDTDALLLQLAIAIQACADQQPDALAARLNGADFALLICGTGNASPQLNELLQTLVNACGPYIGQDPCIFMGAGHCQVGTDISKLLAEVDAALAGAEMTGTNTIHEATVAQIEASPRTTAEWSHTLGNALTRRWTMLVSYPVQDLAGKLLHPEGMLRLKFDEYGMWQSAGTFLPIAERLRITYQLDLAAAALGLEELTRNAHLPGLALNLAPSSLENPEFRHKLKELLMTRHKAAKRLWFEVAENGALNRLEAFSAFCNDIRPIGCRLGLEHFGRNFSQVGKLHGLGLDYIKVDASFILDLESNKGNQMFLKGLAAIGHNIGLQVIAEGVANTTQLAVLKELGFDGATGPAIKESA